jgi:hypothetical protein
MATTNMSEVEYFVWNFQRSQWWHHERGYTQLIKDARRFSFDDALRICLDSNIAEIDEAMVPVPRDGHKRDFRPGSREAQLAETWQDWRELG